jgi:threonine dehydratase
VLNEKDRMAGQTICVVLSGGNADPALFAEIIRTESLRDEAAVA